MPVTTEDCFVFAGVVVVGLSLPTMFQAREYRVLRAVVFVLLGSWGVVPVTHLLLKHGHVWAIRRAFQLDMLMGLIYIVSSQLSISGQRLNCACQMGRPEQTVGVRQWAVLSSR